MDIYELNGTLLANFFIGGSACLSANKEQVNALNVFPVPDGDTGTNMGLTMVSAVKDVLGKEAAGDVAAKVANGALMGARGNSGVILSQILRGFAHGLEHKQIATAVDFANAMQKGVELAYKSVMRPVEGTILSVSKAMAKSALQTAKKKENLTIPVLLEVMLQDGKKALANTPNQLPALKQAGVVDAGGMGLLCIFEGGLKALLGEESYQLEQLELQQQTVAKPDWTKQPADVDDKSDLKYCYCTEFFIHGKQIDVEKIRQHLANMGESQVIVGNEEMVKTHIHTDNPGAVLSYVIQFGSLHDIKIDNMKDQHRETIVFDEQEKQATAAPEIKPEDYADCGVVAVASGEGLSQIFTEMGVGKIISGGQSMNPSAEEIVNAIQEIPAKEVIVLPNNSNIILAAEQAQKLVEKPVYIVPTKFLTQGLSALLAFDPSLGGEENKEAMWEASQGTKSAQITYAVRDSVFDGQEIHENDILGLVEGKISVVSDSITDAVLKVLQEMVNEDLSLITLLYGADVQEADAKMLAETVQTVYPEMEVEMQFGGQGVYYYLVAVE